MDHSDRSSLDDQQMLFALLTALVKKSGGEIRISEVDLEAVTKSDIMMMYYDKVSKELILSLQFLGGYIDETDTVH